MHWQEAVEAKEEAPVTVVALARGSRKQAICISIKTNNKTATSIVRAMGLLQLDRGLNKCKANRINSEVDSSSEIPPLIW